MVLRHCWLRSTRVKKSFQGILTDQVNLNVPTAQEHVAKLSQENDPTFYVFHPVTSNQRPLLAYMSWLSCPHVYLCIWVCCPLHRHQQLKRPSTNTVTQESDQPSCDFPCCQGFESCHLVGGPPRNLTWGEHRLHSLVCQPMQGQVQPVTHTCQHIYPWVQLHGQFCPNPNSCDLTDAMA